MTDHDQQLLARVRHDFPYMYTYVADCVRQCV